jgi:hypothetical protein
METNTHYNLEIRIRGGKLALDDSDVLAHINTDTLNRDERRVVELVEDDRVEIWESSFMDGPCRVYRLQTTDSEVAKQYGFEMDEPTYTGFWCTGYTYAFADDFEAVKKPADLVAIIDQMAKKIAEAREVLTTPGVEIADIGYDKRNGFEFWLTTTDAAVAAKFGWEAA